METTNTQHTDITVTSPLQQVREELISQGAEGRLYSTVYENKPCIVKERFKKEYRHPVLDEKITKERLTMESRCITRCRVKAGLDSPFVYTIDSLRSRIYMEYIHGCTIKVYLYQLQQQLYDIEDQIKYYQNQTQPSPPEGVSLSSSSSFSSLSSSSSSSSSLSLQFYQTLYEYEQMEQEKEYAALATVIGTSIAKLHMDGNIIHGDLTTSNMMLRNYTLESSSDIAIPTPPAPIVWTPDSSSSLSSSSTTATTANDSTHPPSLSSSSTPVQEYGYLTLRHPKYYKQITVPHELSIASANLGSIVSSIVKDPAPIHCRLVFIDFGLSASSGGNEERGVDLYVLERALLSTHADIAKSFFQAILDHYYAGLPEKFLSVIRTKFEQVRMRGRKRLAFG